jgi:hypothetical protein
MASGSVGFVSTLCVGVASIEDDSVPPNTRLSDDPRQRRTFPALLRYFDYQIA